MKVVVLLFVLGVFATQTYAQVIRTAAMAAPIVQTNSVGTTLADTLSLLTVSSLLAEKLPFDYPCGCGYAPYEYAPYECAPYEYAPYVAPMNYYGYPYVL